MKRKLRAGILGATGTVGQRLVQMLQIHPWFEVTELAASDRSTGQRYEEACAWKLNRPMPEGVRHLILKAPGPGLECDLVFSSLPSEVAGEIEEAFARAGYPVISNSSNHRMDEDVPLLIPEVNATHIDIIPFQKKRRGYDRGFIVTNPNCSAIALALALAPLQKAFGLRTVLVTTMQAISGAGYPGVASLDIADNVIPYIKNEEEKVEKEPLKIFGSLENNAFANARFHISAQCNRVNVSDGHLETVSVKLEKRPTRNELIEAFGSFDSPLQQLSLPSAPLSPVIMKEEIDRPQPRLDRELADGMVSVVGRVRECPVLDYKFLVLSHNTIRGAAGAALLNAELLKARGYLN